MSSEDATPEPRAALRETYRGHAAVWLGIEPHLLQLRAGGAGRGPEPRSEPGLGPKPNGKKRVTTARYLLQVLAVRPDAAERVRARLKPDELEEDERGAYVRLLETLQRGGFEALGREVSEYPEEEQDLIRQAWHNPPPSVDDALVDELAGVEFRAGGPPVVSNLDALPHADGAAWRDRSAKHVSVPVRWRESVLAMVNGSATTFLEVGHGTMLAGLAKRTVPDVPVRGIATPDDAAALVLEEVR